MNFSFSPRPRTAQALVATLLGLLIAVGTLHAGEDFLQNGGFEKAEFSSAWTLVNRGDAEGQLIREARTDRNETNSHSLRLTVAKPGAQCGLASATNGAFAVRAEAWYDLTFQARTEKRENGRGYGLTVSVEDETGTKVCARTTIPEVGGDWADYTVALRTRSSDPKARLVISLSEPGTIWFDNLSLQLRNPETAQRSDN